MHLVVSAVCSSNFLVKGTSFRGGEIIRPSPPVQHRVPTGWGEREIQADKKETVSVGQADQSKIPE